MSGPWGVVFVGRGGGRSGLLSRGKARQRACRAAVGCSNKALQRWNAAALADRTVVCLLLLLLTVHGHPCLQCHEEAGQHECR